MHSDHFLTKVFLLAQCKKIIKKCSPKVAKSTSLFRRTKIGAFNNYNLVKRMNRYRLKVHTWYSFRQQHTFTR